MRTGNPALSDKVFQGMAGTTDRMTVEGAVNKSFMLIFLVTVSAYFTWQSAYPGGWGEQIAPIIPGWYYPAMIGGVIMSFVIIFKPTTAPFLAPVYAILEGAILGALSAMFEVRYPGIVMQAVLCTIGTFLALLLAYRSKLIEATENFKLGIFAATGGVCLVYILDLTLGLFGIRMPYLHESGFIGIGISMVIVAIAAFNLVLDFDFIERGAERGAPKYMEWYAAFGLLVTLIWLYVEILRLLGKGRK